MKAKFLAGSLSAILLFAPLVAKAADGVLDQVKQRGVLRVCEADYPPLNIKDPMTGNWTGLLVEMADAFGASQNVKVEHVDSTWGTVIQDLKAGRCDLSAVATFVTPARAKQALFTDTVIEDSNAAFVATDAPYKSYAELDQADKQIAVISGSVNEQNAKETFKAATVRPMITDRQQTPLLEVASGRADGAFVSVMATKNFLTANKSIKLRQVDDTKLFVSPIAWMVASGEQKLSKAIDTWLASARADGSVDALEKKWLRQP